MRLITSLYWNNVAPEIVTGQRQVFASLGLEVAQYQLHGLRHGRWMDRMLERAGPDDVILFLDIDAFPLNREIVERAFQVAEAGGVFAVAHAANHLPDAETVFAGPMFLCVSRATWEKVGRVSMLETATTDVGQAFSNALKAHGVAIELLWPSFVGLPRWALGPRNAIGIATFYGGAVFHLFESRTDQGFNYAFTHVAERIVANRPLELVALHDRLNAPAMRRENWRRRKVTRWRNKVRRVFFGKPKPPVPPDF